MLVGMQPGGEPLYCFNSYLLFWLCFERFLMDEVVLSCSLLMYIYGASGWASLGRWPCACMDYYDTTVILGGGEVTEMRVNSTVLNGAEQRIFGRNCALQQNAATASKRKL